MVIWIIAQLMILFFVIAVAARCDKRRPESQAVSNSFNFLGIILFILILIAIITLQCEHQEIPIYDIIRTNGVMTVVYPHGDTFKTVKTEVASLYAEEDKNIALEQYVNSDIFGGIRKMKPYIVNRYDLQTNKDVEEK